MKKKIATLLAVFMIGAAITGCSSSKGGDETSTKDVSTVEIVNEIKEAIEMRPTGPVEGDLAKEQYHLNLDDVEEYTIENGMMNTGLESLTVVKAKDGKADSVKASLEKVLEDKKAQAFYPGEPEAVDAAKLEVIGNYVGLFIIPDYDGTGEDVSGKALEIFEKAVK